MYVSLSNFFHDRKNHDRRNFMIVTVISVTCLGDGQNYSLKWLPFWRPRIGNRSVVCDFYGGDTRKRYQFALRRRGRVQASRCGPAWPGRSGAVSPVFLVLQGRPGACSSTWAVHYRGRVQLGNFVPLCSAITFLCVSVASSTLTPSPCPNRTLAAP